MSGTKIRKRVAALGSRNRGQRIPRKLREEIADYARRRRAEGGRVREIASEVGVSPESIRRWASTAGGDIVALPVRVQPDDEASAIVVVTPGGVRIEGLDIAQATELARRLG